VPKILSYYLGITDLSLDDIFVQIVAVLVLDFIISNIGIAYILSRAPQSRMFSGGSENPANRLKLIGEAYVHGIMYGEALTAGPVEFERMGIH
jgi:hypothetical protein